MRRITIAGALVACVLATVPAAAQADGYSTSFEAPDFGVGPVHDQGGWQSMLPATDANVVANGVAVQALGLGEQSLQLSNAVSNGAVRQVEAPGTVEAAGETEAVGGVGVRHSRFRAGFAFAAFDLALQDGLSLHASPTDRAGHRMTAVQIQDDADGLRILALDPVDNGPGNSVTWPEYEPIAVDIDRTEAHVLELAIDYADGPANDVVRIYLDGELIHTAGTWEQYYRNDPEQLGSGNTVPVARTLSFAARSPWDAAVPALQGEGLLVDDLAVATSTPPPEPDPIGDPPPFVPEPTPPVVDTSEPQDERPPTLLVGGKGGSSGTVQQGGFAGGKKAVTLALRCNERCAVRATGSLSLKANGKPVKLKAVMRTLRRGAKTTIRLRLAPAARRAVRRALRNGKVVRAKVALRVRDAAGNVRLVRRTVRLRA